MIALPHDERDLKQDGPHTILLVCDNPDERELYESGLAEYAFKVHSIEHLDGFEEAVRRLRPSISVLNLSLGRADTWQRLNALRCGETMAVPGVVLTASVRSDAANRHRVRLSGCAAFVAKPCPPDALVPVLLAVLSGARDLVILDPMRLRDAGF